MMRLQPRMVSASGFSHSVLQAEVEQLGGGVVVRAGVRRAIGRFEAVDLADHLLGVAEHSRPLAEQLMRLIREVFGVLAVEVAHGDQVEVSMLGTRQLGKPGQMATSHAAATDDSQTNRIAHAVSSRLRVRFARAPLTELGTW